MKPSHSEGEVMATFYVLPPREALEAAVSSLFAKLLPGLPLPADVWGTLSEHLARAAGWPDDVFLVPRDELPDGDAAEALAEGYGADAADRVIEVSLARGPRGVSLAGR
jgi:hypothetical protein